MKFHPRLKDDPKGSAVLSNLELRSCVKRAVAYFREDIRLIGLLFACIALAGFAGLLQAWPLAVLIDSVIAPAGERQQWIHSIFLSPFPNEPLARIFGLAGIAFGLRLFQEAAATGRKLVSSRINYNGLMRVRCDLFRKMQALHLDYHRSQPLGDAIFRLSTDTFGCHMILSVLINLIFAVITLSLITFILFLRSPSLTLIALSVAPPLIWINCLFGRRLGTKSDLAKKADSAYTVSVQRSLSAISLVQAFSREDDELHRFRSATRHCIRSWFGIHRQEVAYGLCVGAILGLGGALTLSYGGHLVYQKVLSPGELMVFMSYLGMMYDPLCQLTGANFNLQSGAAGARRIFDVLDRDAMVSDSPNAGSLAVKRRTLALEEVGFRYGSGAPVLDGISISIMPGQSVAFVGSSGVGKSTLLNLLPRFYEPTSGRITLDGHDLKTIRLKDLRRHIAVALQDSVILPTTIQENIAYGRPEATAAEIREAARLAGAASFIETLPYGYETELNENGLNLSGGQRQRIAIARALLTKAPILILDEPTSSQDAQHEEILRSTLHNLRGKRTLILVSHRITTIRDCDLICVLERGKIVERGTHDELMSMRGSYYALAERGKDPLFRAA